MTLNPLRLRLLCQLETLGTVRAVAEAVHQSASSVSQQLSVLEKEAGSQLIERTGRGVRLTPTGSLLAQRGRSILDQIAATEEELRSLDATPTGVVRVAAFQSAIHSLAVPAAARLKEPCPDLDVHVLELEGPVNTAALLQGDIDVVITTPDYVDIPSLRDLHTLPLLTDAVMLVAPPGHWVTRQERLDLGTLANEPWTFEPDGHYLSSLALRLCRSSGFEPRVVCRFGNYLLTLQHVAAGGSLALLPQLAVDPRFDVVARELVPATTRRIVAATRPISAASTGVRVVLEALRAQAESLRGPQATDPCEDGA